MASAYGSMTAPLVRPETATTTTLPPQVSATRTIAVDAAPAAVCAALQALDLGDRLTGAAVALGLGARLALAPTLVPARHGETLRLGAVLRIGAAAAGETVGRDELDGFRGPGHIKVVWEIRVEGSGEDDQSFVSLRTVLGGTDEAARARLLDGWSVAGALVDTVARRMAAAIKARAERDEPAA